MRIGDREDGEGWSISGIAADKDFWNGEIFEEIDELRPLYFTDKAKCQEYCDYLNKKNGVTDDMTVGYW